MTEIKLTADERPESASATLRRGLRMMPEFRRGLPVTFLLALIATAGRVVVWPCPEDEVLCIGLRGRRASVLELPYEPVAALLAGAGPHDAVRDQPASRSARKRSASG